MADSHAQTDQPLPNQTPLLYANQNHSHQEHRPQEVEVNEDIQLDQTLQRLENFLTFLGFNQSSRLSLVLSWTAFVLFGVVLPVLVLELFDCSNCEAYQIKNFELVIVASQACLAAVSLLCVSHNLRKYGIRKFLFVDRHSGYMLRFRNDYIKQISSSLRLLVLWALPCFLLKTVREVLRSVYVHDYSWWLSVAILFGLVLSWVYVSTISLAASIMFHMVCNLQVIHFVDYGKLLERESDVMVFIEEHLRLRYHLSKISHRFRIFLLLQFILVTASQFVTLFQTTGYSGLITFINSGDFAVSSIVQVVGMFLCLHAATRISHRAQGIASLASRWHALVTCNSDASHHGASNNLGNLLAADNLNVLDINYSESDLESLEYVAMPTQTQLASYMSSYHRRQAFGNIEDNEVVVEKDNAHNVGYEAEDEMEVNDEEMLENDIHNDIADLVDYENEDFSTHVQIEGEQHEQTIEEDNTDYNDGEKLVSCGESDDDRHFIMARNIEFDIKSQLKNVQFKIGQTFSNDRTTQ